MRSSSFPSRRDAGASRPLRVAAAAVLCAAVLLPACSVLPEAQPLDVYVLPVTGHASAGAVSAARETARATAPAAPASARASDCACTGPRAYTRGTYEDPNVIEMLSDPAIDIDPIISHRFPFPQFMAALAMARDTTHSAKVMVTFDV